MRPVAFALGALVAVGTLSSAFRTFVVPRPIQVGLSRAVFQAIRAVLRLVTSRARTYEAYDRVFAFYAPLGLISLPMAWLTLLLFSFAAMYWGLGADPWRAIEVSGSSLFTLGFAVPDRRPSAALSFIEGGLGIALLALLISYLPTIYATFQRREQWVALLEVRAGSPPSGVEMIQRLHAIGLHESESIWVEAERWFADVEESHTSLAALPFFRSPDPRRHWVTAAGAILDGAAITLSSLDAPFQPHAALCIRSGFLCLRSVASYFRVDFDADPAPTDPISVTREQFDDALGRLEQRGVPIKPDRDQCWRDFAGWRVNYDVPLRALARVTRAPAAPWSSD